MTSVALDGDWAFGVPSYLSLRVLLQSPRIRAQSARWEYKKQQPFSGEKTACLSQLKHFAAACRFWQLPGKARGEFGGCPWLYLCSGPKELLTGLCVTTGTNRNFASFGFVLFGFFSERSCNVGGFTLWGSRLGALRSWASNLRVIGARRSQANSNPFTCLFLKSSEDSVLERVHGTTRCRLETASFCALT